MKHRTIVMIVLCIFMVPSIGLCQQCVKWEKYDQNPVLDIGEGNYAVVYEPNVIYEDGIYKMWYISYPSDRSTNYVYYATSLNGKSWTKYPDPIITVNNMHVQHITLLRDESGYKMWAQLGLNRIPYFLTSYDGIHWDEANEYLLGSQYQFEDPFVIKHAGLYVLYHTVSDFTPGHCVNSLWVTTSVDGKSWPDYPGTKVLDCIIGPRPWVMYFDDQFHMWVTLDSLAGIWHFISPDGMNWQQDACNPALTVGEIGEFDELGLDHPTVVRKGSSLKMWYVGGWNWNTDGKIGYASVPFNVSGPSAFQSVPTLTIAGFGIMGGLVTMLAVNRIRKRKNVGCK